MKLIKELNDTILILKELEEAFNDLKDEEPSMLLEAPINPEGGIDWVPPTEKRTITKTPAEERVARKTPVVQKGSRVLIPMEGKNVIGIVTDVQGGNILVSMNYGGRVMRLPPQPREKFTFSKADKTGKSVFVLKGNFKANKPAPEQQLPPS